MYVRPEHEGEPLTLRVSGKLWRDALIMFDRETKTLWSQVLGEGVAGPLEGKSLDEIPSQVTTWKAWKERHPDTQVLVKGRIRGSSYQDYHSNPSTIGVFGSANADNRMGPKILVYGLEIEEKPVAIPFLLLEKSPALGLEAFGVPLLVVSPPGENTGMAYRRRLGERQLDFDSTEHEGRFALKDLQTGSIWSWETGTAIAGELQGQRLESIEGAALYWGVWARYHPGSEIVGVR